MLHRSKRRPFRRFALLLVPTLFAPAPAGAQVTLQEYQEAVKEVPRATKDLDVDGFLAAFATILRADDERAFRTAIAAYSGFASKGFPKMARSEFQRFLGKAAAAFAATRARDTLAEFKKQSAKHKDWQVRLLLLHAAAFAKGVDLLEGATIALGDANPAVVRQALQYLRKARKPEVVGLIIKRWIEISKGKEKGGSAHEWQRTALHAQSVLREMLKVDLLGAEDYKNYFESRRTAPDLFDPKHLKEGGSTGLTLFGAAITGKNIVFVLDISGSMLSIDPRPPGEEDPDRGRTVVGDPSKDPGIAAKDLERERIRRAKRELARVVRALGDDLRFNIIPYSTEVVPWQKSLVPATDANKKSAVAFIEGLQAQGLTFTDDALEAAFADLELDTIYLITDGAPTHVGDAPGAPRGLKQEDSDAIIAHIHVRVADLNFLRDVRIFTLGFQGAEEDFLRKLSRDNAGQYVRIR